MASACIRSAGRTSLFSLRSCLKPKLSSSKPPSSSSFGSSASRVPNSFISRAPVELGCCSGSMFPLHSAIAAARLTSRLSSTSQSCRDLSQGTLCRTSPGL
ncbi:hypothetical protein ZOSMA_31G01320 [Zostera marina]|uniref:Protein NUCLEAR FUSION DEFECTIVE 6, chloroplastic/mitochondrial-like n=1 Tax=Zostera marina TaxID=29655 RepID=A0A0K9P8Z5_ZOSMR|nr:hypothetical protein ZOSMA_31G01320 [Zostera marina]